MSKYKRLIQEIVGSVDYWAQAAMRHFVVEIDARMRARDMSRAMLAEKMATTPAYVTKVMRGDVNFTLETMTKLAMAVGGKLQIRVIDQSEPMSISKPIGLVRQSQTPWLVQKETPMRAEATRKVLLKVVSDAANAPRYDYERLTGSAA